MRSLITAFLAISCASARPAALSTDSNDGTPRPISDLLPAESLVVYMAKPLAVLEPASLSSATTQSAGGGSPLAAILAFLNVSGLLAEEGQVYADVAAALPLLGRFEHACALLDVSSHIVPKVDDSPADSADISLRLERLQGVLILRTEGANRAVVEQLNRLIGRYTNADVAELAKAVTHGYRYQRLVDERLPGWAVWEWGRIDEFFIAGFGAGSFERVAETFAAGGPCLTRHEWYRAASRQIQGNEALAQCYLALARLQQELGPAAEGRFARVMTALEADRTSYDLWTIGLNDRALTWYRCYRRGSEDVVRRYSDPPAFPERHRQIIPPTAAHHAIIKVPTKWLVDNVPKAWVAARSEGQAQTWGRVWARLEQETGIDIDGNLISHLGEHVVLFDYPPHPLRIPFALTIAFEIDDQEPVRVALDALLSAWSRYLDERARRSRTPLLRVKVQHSRDGIWYLQAGILGPALKVTDRYIVISWSPQALRDALDSIAPGDKSDEKRPRDRRDAR